MAQRNKKEGLFLGKTFLEWLEIYNFNIFRLKTNFVLDRESNHHSKESCQEYSNKCKLKPLSYTTNVVGLQTDDAGHVGQNCSAHVTLIVGLQIDAVVVTKTGFKL